MGEPIHQPLIIEAVKRNDFAEINNLMEHGMIEGSCDEDGRTLLHLAVSSHCDVKIIKYFTETIGIHPLTDDCFGETPYDMALSCRFEEIIQYFEEYTNIKRDRLMHNPIRPGFFPDPSIIAVGNDFYMVNSSFMYFPCIPISHSRDLINWEIIGHAISDSSYINLENINPGHGFWAPDISYSNGTFYITATLRENNQNQPERHQIIVTSKNPEGPYSKPVFIEEDGIDPSLFHDDDGKHYMLLNKGARLIPLSDDCLSVAGPSQMLYYGWNRHASEGPHIIKNNGYYYLFLAEGGTGDNHMETVARSNKLTGPFIPCPHNPILTTIHKNGYLSRTGHGKPFKTADGDWFMVYLCSRKLHTGYSLLGRETALCRLFWDNDGWPVVNDGLGPISSMKSPFESSKVITGPQTIDFSQKLPLSVVWHHNLILTRQTSINAFTTLILKPAMAKEGSLGLIFYYDDNSFLKFGIEKGRLNTILSIALHNASISEGMLVTFAETIPGDTESLKLCVNTEVLKKTFSYSANGSELMQATHLDDCSFLTDEGLSMGKRFEGPMIGVYGYASNPDAFCTLTT